VPLPFDTSKYDDYENPAPVIKVGALSAQDATNPYIIGQNSELSSIDKLYDARAKALRDARLDTPDKTDRIMQALLAFGAPTRGNNFAALSNATKALSLSGKEVSDAEREQKNKLIDLQAQQEAARAAVLGKYGFARAEEESKRITDWGKPTKPSELATVVFDANGLVLNPYTGQKPLPGIVAYTKAGEGLTQEQMDNLNARYPVPTYGAKPAPSTTSATGQPVSAAAPPIAAQPQKDSSTYKQVATRREAWALQPGTTGVLPNGKEFTRTTTGLEEVKGVDADTSVQDTDDAKALAAKLYIPYNPAPMPTFKTASKRDEYVKSVAEQGANTLLDLEKDGREAASLASKAKQFMAINEKVITNPLTGNVPAALQSAEIQSLKTIATGLIPVVPRTPGAQSNLDAVNLGKSTMSPTNPKEVNDAIGRRYIAYDQLNYENQQFLNDWRTVHSGSTQGAEVVWKRYLRENPVFDPKEPEKAIPNKRLQFKDWAKQTYYGEKAPAAAKTPASSPNADKQITKTIGGVTYVKFGPGPNDWAAK